MGGVRGRPPPGLDTRDEAVFDIFVMWGGAEIKVPEDWEVVTRGVPVLGGLWTTPGGHIAGRRKRLSDHGHGDHWSVEVKN